MYYQREISKKLAELAQLYSVVLVTGPRQSGKTELVRHQFPDHRWVLLDRPSVVDQARHDPTLFLKNHPRPVIFDEVQRTKSLFLELKALVDEAKPPKGSYILTGSQPFLLMQEVSESLAGRIGIVELLPMTVSELMQRSPVAQEVRQLLQEPPIGERFVLPRTPAEMLVRGFFPAMALDEHSPSTGAAVQRMSDYVQTYLTKDLRDLSMLRDLAGYEKLLRQLAIYAAQPLNLSEVASSVGLKQSTVFEWLSLTEAAYLYRRIPGYHRRLGRRESKRAKGLFIDCGLTTSLLGYQSADQLMTSPLLGRIFESAAIVLVMQALAGRAKLYHWRVDEAREVDLVLEVSPTELIPVEVKMTARPRAEDALGISAFMQAYPEASHGILVTLCEDCYWLSERILHVPFAML